MTSQNKVFWMVYVEGIGVPNQKFYTYPEAEVEAEKLMLKEGRDVIILEAVSHGQFGNVIWERLGA